jgi:hypothetical protein
MPVVQLLNDMGHVAFKVRMPGGVGNNRYCAVGMTLMADLSEAET